MLAEILSRVNVEDLTQQLKKSGKTKEWDEIVDACEIYGLKHYSRADNSLKHSYYLQYVMQQITLQADSKREETKSVPKKRETKAKIKKEQKNLF
jgi:hypothetical protein